MRAEMIRRTTQFNFVMLIASLGLGGVSCVKECKAGAIDFFLGADIGGNGSIMNVKSEGDILHWIITKTDGSTSVIDVDRRNSNKY